MKNKKQAVEAPLVRELLLRIERHDACVAVVGLGYVGLPLALSFGRAGFKVVGIDISKERIADIRKGRSYIDDISSAQLRKAKASCDFTATPEFTSLKKADAVIICVPTPLSKTRQPDLSYIIAAFEEIGKYLHKGQVVVLESTTYPGTTEEHMLPLLEKKSGFKVEEDFFLGFSPERVDPANRQFAIEDIPKVVGGVGPASARLIQALYGGVFKTIVPVSSSRSAEMGKLLENTFRSVNIGLVNEMAMICEKLKVDIWEVIDAAKSKPFGFMPFYPGPGIGGHCISIDPLYLAWKSRLHGYEPRLIELAQSISDQMPAFVAHRAGIILNDYGKSVKGSHILLLGLAYKKNVRDTRESPSLAVMLELMQEGARVAYHDPFVPSIEVGGRKFHSVKVGPAVFKRQNLIVILTNHDGVDYDAAVRAKVPIFDTRNALGRMGRAAHQVVRL